MIFYYMAERIAVLYPGDRFPFFEMQRRPEREITSPYL